MDRRKIESAALFITVLGVMLIMPPLALLFHDGKRIAGIPFEVIYLFAVWGALVFAAAWLGQNLPQEQVSEAPAEDDG